MKNLINRSVRAVYRLDQIEEFDYCIGKCSQCWKREHNIDDDSMAEKMFVVCRYFTKLRRRQLEREVRSMIHGTIDNFDEQVLQAKGFVLVDFWAEWCGPCQMIAPILEELEQSVDGLTVCKVNVDENMELAQKYKVVAIPFLLLFQDGELKEKTAGLQSKEDLQQMVEKYRA